MPKPRIVAIFGYGLADANSLNRHLDVDIVSGKAFFGRWVKCAPHPRLDSMKRVMAQGSVEDGRRAGARAAGRSATHSRGCPRATRREIEDVVAHYLGHEPLDYALELPNSGKNARRLPLGRYDGADTLRILHLDSFRGYANMIDAITVRHERQTTVTLNS